MLALVLHGIVQTNTNTDLTDTVDLICHKNSISLESLESNTHKHVFSYIPDKVGSILPAGSIKKVSNLVRIMNILPLYMNMHDLHLILTMI